MPPDAKLTDRDCMLTAIEQARRARLTLTYPPHHTPQDTMDKISAKSLAVVGDVATALVTR